MELGSGAIVESVVGEGANASGTVLDGTSGSTALLVYPEQRRKEKGLGDLLETKTGSAISSSLSFSCLLMQGESGATIEPSARNGSIVIHETGSIIGASGAKFRRDRDLS